MKNTVTVESMKKLMTEWDNKTTKAFAKEFGVSMSDIHNWVTKIRKANPDKCPKKRSTKSTTYDVSSSFICDVVLIRIPFFPVGKAYNSG